MQIKLHIGLGLCQALINYCFFFQQALMPSHDLPMLLKGNDCQQYIWNIIVCY